jgi:carboxypeptidase C (cathepsin A)
MFLHSEFSMPRRFPAMLAAASLALTAAASAEEPRPSDASSGIEHFKPEHHQTRGSLSLAGKRLDYDAYTGTLVVHPRDWDDVARNADPDDKTGPAEASMFYVAYLRTGTPVADRPISFIFNGGPGVPTLWLHMGAFGPRRVVTTDHAHTPAAPYTVINNDFSLLDASDLVFIDAPGTGFRRVAGKDHDKAFFGVDADAQAFADFITQFLSAYGRWNSPKFIFGESYGTTRAAALVNLLESRDRVDVNGVILLSQSLNYDVLPDHPDLNPGVEEPYELWLPSFATTAWYHHRLPGPARELGSLVEEVEHFASGEYVTALHAGAALDPQGRQRIIERLHAYTGLPADYIDKANLRITQGGFQKKLLEETGQATGAYDTRFTGPIMDPLSKEADYDPYDAAVSSAFGAAFNDYVRSELHYSGGRTYRQLFDIEVRWDFSHQPPGSSVALHQQVNVMPDLATAMTFNPNLKVQLNAGYFDLVTPFYQGVYEMRHLAIPAKLQQNIEYHLYDAGHMVYVHEPALAALHENVAAFIRRNAGSGSTH